MAIGERDTSAVPDVGDEEQVKSKKSVHKLERDVEIAELGVLLQDYRMRKFLWRVLEMCRYGDPAPYIDIKRFEGRRDVGVELVEEIWTSDLQAYTIMMREADARANGSTIAVSRDTIVEKGKK